VERVVVTVQVEQWHIELIPLTGSCLKCGVSALERIGLVRYETLRIVIRGRGRTTDIAVVAATANHCSHDQFPKLFRRPCDFNPLPVLGEQVADINAMNLLVHLHQREDLLEDGS
jgi:hypothetical protein